MAEGIFDGILGGDDEAAEELRSEAAIGAESLAMAHVMDQARTDPDIARQTSEFLAEQTRLVKLQATHFLEEQRLRLTHMRNQSREGKLRRVGQRIRIGMQVFIALIASVIGLGFGLMLYDAFTSHSVVVDAFQAPQALASRGLTGDVVAAGVLDTLQKLKDATRSDSKGLETRSAWSSDIRIEVPETGVSIGEINRLLHARFGHDLHIDGDLVQTVDGGLALTVRGDGMPAKTFSGGASDLDKLTTEAAEYVYGRSQPVQYATYLYDAGRIADDLAFISAAYVRAPEYERADLARLWGNAFLGLNKPVEGAEKYRLAMALQPRNWKAWGDLANALIISPGEEAAWQESKRFLQAASDAPKSEKPPLRDLSTPAQIVWDLPLALAANLDETASNGVAGAQTVLEGPALADFYGLMHDPAPAARYMAASDPEDSVTKAEAAVLPVYALLDNGSETPSAWATTLPPLEAFWKAWQADPSLQTTATDYPCYLGLAYGMTGRIAEAEAVFKRVGRWSRCYAFHGDTLARAGDWAGAERAWSDGLKVAPDLPHVYLNRGVWEMKRGSFKAAWIDFATAHAKASHYADPLKAWGDLLMRIGNPKAALAKYNEALQYAPAWTALHQARDAAARAGARRG